jgi:hypothetical protein
LIQLISILPQLRISHIRYLLTNILLSNTVRFLNLFIMCCEYNISFCGLDRDFKYFSLFGVVLFCTIRRWFSVNNLISSYACSLYVGGFNLWNMSIVLTGQCIYCNGTVIFFLISCLLLNEHFRRNNFYLTSHVFCLTIGSSGHLFLIGLLDLTRIIDLLWLYQSFILSLVTEFLDIYSDINLS